MLHKKSDRLCFLTVAQQVTFLKLLRQRLKHVLNPKILPKIIIRANKTQHYPSRSLLLRRFVFRMAERVSAKRVTGDEPQGTMGRLRTAGEAPSLPLSPSRLPLRAHFNQKKRLGTRQIQSVSLNLNRPQTGLPCDRACNSNITADHFYNVSAKKPIELWSSNQQPSFSTSRRVFGEFTVL